MVANRYVGLGVVTIVHQNNTEHMASLNKKTTLKRKLKVSFAYINHRLQVAEGLRLRTKISRKIRPVCVSSLRSTLDLLNFITWERNKSLVFSSLSALCS